MTTELSIVSLMLGASLPVQLVMLLLVLASLLSWLVIFDRANSIKKAKKSAKQFEQRFWAGSDMGDLYRYVERQGDNSEGMALIFRSGFREFLKLRETKSIDGSIVIDSVRRAMHVSMSREVDRLEHHLPFLATVGSISPYVGLLGTVWGIMSAFLALGAVKQASLAMVAPGIAEALIATAMGLFAAIPAVVAYNRYSTDVERLHGQYEDFLEEFANILQRRALRA